MAVRTECRLHSPFIHQLREISTFAPLSPDDARPGDYGAAASRAVEGKSAQFFMSFRQGSSLLLPAARPLHSRSRCHGGVLHRARRQHDVLESTVRRVAAGVRVFAAGGVPHLVQHHPGAVSGLQVVCRGEAEKAKNPLFSYL